MFLSARSRIAWGTSVSRANSSNRAAVLRAATLGSSDSFMVLPLAVMLELACGSQKPDERGPQELSALCCWHLTDYGLWLPDSLKLMLGESLGKLSRVAS